MSNNTKEATFASFGRPPVETYMDPAACVGKLSDNLRLHKVVQPHHKLRDALVV